LLINRFQHGEQRGQLLKTNSLKWLNGGSNGTQGERITDPPEQWTTAPEEMQTAYYWGTDGVGTAVAKSVGLSNPTGLMVKSSEYGGAGYFFTAGGKYYLWNMIADQVFEYTEPADLDGILAEMRKLQGKGKVQTTELMAI
jgi:hypothetical protein